MKQFEKVNPGHPDKIADRIAGALVDLAYKKEENPRIAVEVLIGHGDCHIIAETTVHITDHEVVEIVERIAGPVKVDYKEVPQDEHLQTNQKEEIRCGDNGIFRGEPVKCNERELTEIASKIWDKYHKDGKYILTDDRLIICQSNVMTWEATKELTYLIEPQKKDVDINPIGPWTGGPDVDSGATNRKLGSDMGDAITGGGLHGKDLSKADVTLNIYAHLKAAKNKRTELISCAIGDSIVDGKKYSEIVEIARAYIKEIGGFEAFAEWGLIRPIK